MSQVYVECNPAGEQLVVIHDPGFHYRNANLALQRIKQSQGAEKLWNYFRLLRWGDATIIDWLCGNFDEHENSMQLLASYFRFAEVEEVLVAQYPWLTFY